MRQLSAKHNTQIPGPAHLHRESRPHKITQTTHPLQTLVSKPPTHKHRNQKHRHTSQHFPLFPHRIGKSPKPNPFHPLTPLYTHTSWHTPSTPPTPRHSSIKHVSCARQYLNHVYHPTCPALTTHLIHPLHQHCRPTSHHHILSAYTHATQTNTTRITVTSNHGIHIGYHDNFADILRMTTDTNIMDTAVKSEINLIILQVNIKT